MRLLQLVTKEVKAIEAASESSLRDLGACGMLQLSAYVQAPGASRSWAGLQHALCSAVGLGLACNIPQHFSGELRCLLSLHLHW